MKTFKEISLGGMSKEQLLNRLVEAGVQFNKYAETLFENALFTPKQETRKVRLVKFNLPALGFSGPAVFEDIVKRAKSEGLELCPLYLAAILRLEYLEQPEGPYVNVASTKLDSDENYPRGFYLRKIENTLWLRGYRASDDWEFSGDQEFVFQERHS